MVVFFSTGSNVLYRIWVRENLPSVCCCAAVCVNPQTEGGKIGHFHIYLSVRSGAVCRERERWRKRGKRAATTGTLRFSPAFILLFSASKHTHKYARLSACMDTRGRKWWAGKKEKWVEAGGGNDEENYSPLSFTAKLTKQRIKIHYL